ncbi:hypothetical protein NCLIV_005460 [Neospora caninum Liverpool]|uniref:Ion transport domain-containing protein n=1 Tax=Neospora caninum (strain Liverpool) TaxID=572307 RepID=F0V8M9_NEOCL|nr:hypothetical protein NCLIV_005460 [Neospora caninum Liverpool]CBZ50070.1 hypothetical protein NCLIV_005460 [Neospora caninum Liverpool]|eukprot:XP_003880105.1 hypothetical protein NCLIV_005460 [Neospora caninum Liverpool]
MPGESLSSVPAAVFDAPSSGDTGPLERQEESRFSVPGASASPQSRSPSSGIGDVRESRGVERVAGPPAASRGQRHDENGGQSSSRSRLAKLLTRLSSGGDQNVHARPSALPQLGAETSGSPPESDATHAREDSAASLHAASRVSEGVSSTSVEAPSASGPQTSHIPRLPSQGGGLVSPPSASPPFASLETQGSPSEPHPESHLADAFKNRSAVHGHGMGGAYPGRPSRSVESFVVDVRGRWFSEPSHRRRGQRAEGGSKSRRHRQPRNPAGRTGGDMSVPRGGPALAGTSFAHSVACAVPFVRAQDGGAALAAGKYVVKHNASKALQALRAVQAEIDRGEQLHNMLGIQKYTEEQKLKELAAAEPAEDFADQLTCDLKLLRYYTNTEAELELRDRRARAFIYSPLAQIVMAVIIIFNVIFLGFSTLEVSSREYIWDDTQESLKLKRDAPLFVALCSLNCFFALAFFVEMVLRVKCDGLAHFHDFVNVMDFVNAWFGVADLFIVSIGFFQKVENGVFNSVVALLKLARLLRVLRFIRILKSFLPMRVLVEGMESSFFSLLYAASFFLIFIYGFAVFFTTAFGFTAEVKEYWGDLFTSMYTLFLILTMTNWNEIAQRTSVHFTWAKLAIIMYTIFSYFVLFNVVTAVIVEAFSTTAGRLEDEASHFSMFTDFQVNEQRFESAMAAAQLLRNRRGEVTSLRPSSECSGRRKNVSSSGLRLGAEGNSPPKGEENNSCRQQGTPRSVGPVDSTSKLSAASREDTASRGFRGQHSWGRSERGWDIASVDDDFPCAWRANSMRRRLRPNRDDSTFSESKVSLVPNTLDEAFLDVAPDSPYLDLARSHPLQILGERRVQLAMRKCGISYIQAYDCLTILVQKGFEEITGQNQLGDDLQNLTPD